MEPLIIGQYDRPRITLNLHTAERNDIDNEQFAFISSYELSQLSSFEHEYPLALFKGNPTAVYNCHGMTFASKRTGVFEDREIEKILKDDKYIEIKDEKDVMAGDIILYYNETGITHSGTVIQVHPGDHANDLRSIIVLSKWAKHKEVIHNANYSPYSQGAKRYWRVNHGFKII